jgi:molecular chaperone DnaK (HSP70)
MAQARFSIGIDLGTTNSALAFCPLHGDAGSEVLRVAQWDSLTSLTDAPILPSFLYLPEDAAAAQLRDKQTGRGEWIAGLLARKKAAETPGRVAHSSKSWLCHHTADRAAPFLPWGSEDIARERKISPIRASALILNYLRGAWNDRFAGSGPDFQFDSQLIAVTVPASFDAVAQRLTLAAAEEAGFPDTVRLLEEPQAAFYRWLEQRTIAEELWRGLALGDTGSSHVLVIDVGGGTSDFSLFELHRSRERARPAIKRVAVSDHILLGGDNIDLAIAHLLERRLDDEAKLSGAQWDHLVARCRDLKERVLASDGPQDAVFAVSIPARGSNLLAGARSASVTRAELHHVLLDGFFPECDASARPYVRRAALQELGLPYASDSAVTSHLAEFMKDRPRVDALLFNGGSLYPPAIRERIRQQIARWQGGAAPIVLDNAEPDLAVVRGAARYGKLLYQQAERIEAGAARAVFLAAHRKSSADGDETREPALVCILPRDAAAEDSFEISERPFELRVDRPVRFQTYSSTRQANRKAGDIVAWNARDFRPLPPLETVARLVKPARADPGRTLPVTLHTTLNELGLLQVSCRSADPRIEQSWPLEFNLRPHDQETAEVPSDSAAPEPVEPNVPPAALAAAQAHIEHAFSRPLGRREKLSAARVLQSLEKVLHLPKGEWNWILIRSLWPALVRCMHCRATSVEHEETWLIVAGFLLRPGFGAPMDEVRIDALWTLRAAGLAFPNKRVKLQEYILWRRVAGGLARERQERILASELGRLRQPKGPEPELVRLAGSLERISIEMKTELIERFIGEAARLANENKHCAHYLAALGLLLNRAPLYAGPETVVSPHLVERAFDAFSGFEWTDPELVELSTLFLRAARVVDNRSLDVPKPVRNRIAAKLEKSSIAPLRTAKVREFMPVDRSERLGLYGEALPPGLLLGEE